MARVVGKSVRDGLRWRVELSAGPAVPTQRG